MEFGAGVFPAAAAGLAAGYLPVEFGAGFFRAAGVAFFCAGFLEVLVLSRSATRFLRPATRFLAGMEFILPLNWEKSEPTRTERLRRQMLRLLRCPWSPHYKASELSRRMFAARALRGQRNDVPVAIEILRQLSCARAVG